MGDETRTWGPPWVTGPAGEDTTESAYYLCANRNKRSVTIDFSRPRGVALVKRILARCDALVENFKVGGLAKFGLGYEQLGEEFPGLVYCSITGFGQTGPYAHRPGYDMMAQGMGGLLSITGEPVPAEHHAVALERRHGVRLGLCGDALGVGNAGAASGAVELPVVERAAQGGADHLPLVQRGAEVWAVVVQGADLPVLASEHGQVAAAEAHLAHLACGELRAAAQPKPAQGYRKGEARRRRHGGTMR